LPFDAPPFVLRRINLSGGKIALLAVKFVVLKGEKSEFGAFFVPIGRFFEDQHILGLDSRRRAHDPVDLRLRHAWGNLFVIGQGQLRTGEWVSIAAIRHSDHAAKQRK
jgi:hypothetical protein